ncbi:hypothetical protein [Methanorbis rubei]|uniref:DUF3566 domain-containing protein n=1 Tax=Methanorbis rubei TaxID=3028300 RepID=A0AAE4MCX2_9EURY|nr:hypothetical protein [Methanocorpusculaceae archaeon Cs1]
METKEVKHIDVWSAAKLSAAIYLVISIIVGIISALIAIFNMTAIPGLSMLTSFGEGILITVLTVVIVAIIGMIVGFIVGAIIAFIYNLAAGIFGGLRLEVE